MKLPIEDAKIILLKNLNEIQTVTNWANQMGYNSSKYFSRKIRDLYGKRPKQIIIELRLQRIREYLKGSNNQIFYWVAIESGFKNDTSLYKFVRRHTGKSLSELRYECKKGW